MKLAKWTRDPDMVERSLSPEEPADSDRVLASPAQRRGHWHGPVSGSGAVTLICGCMFSGKTTELVKRLSGHGSRCVLAFKHVIDQRYQAQAIVSHGGLSWPASPVRSAREILRIVPPDAAFIGIDEGHFFDVDLLDVVRELRSQGHSVVITSLDRSSWGRSFPVVEELVAAADDLLIMYAVCARCGGLATCTQRLTPIVEGHMVGGPESYEPRCLTCWTPPP